MPNQLTIKILRWILLPVVLISGHNVLAQELNFTVTINSDRARMQQTDVFQNMKSTFEQFLNGRSWTGDEFRTHERIKGNLLMTINDMPQVNRFNATVQVQVVRPVFGTNYETLVLNFIDRSFNFEFMENQPLEFNQFNFFNNISSLLAFYAIISIGLDYDTFSFRGGDAFFETANNVVSRAGWDTDMSASNRRNRFWLSNELFNSQAMVPVREAYYLYHRRGMDLMLTNPEEGFKNILASLQNIAEVSQLQPNSILVISFLDAKSDELSKVLKNAPLDIKAEAVEILLKIDPNNSRKYNEILKG
ncbi:type IX secretion system protein PorD [Pararhodonellum marinum]|uniref:type IX secretion system protein PorD n=1 Tax=Pararhodonellum marinum TaxID=2755358 RepID=UPI00188E2950|nr:DUF4835 family protein [Pararhodonellum marinum]